MIVKLKNCGTGSINIWDVFNWGLWFVCSSIEPSTVAVKLFYSQLADLQAKQQFQPILQKSSDPVCTKVAHPRVVTSLFKYISGET